MAALSRANQLLCLLRIMLAFWAFVSLAINEEIGVKDLQRDSLATITPLCHLRLYSGKATAWTERRVAALGLPWPVWSGKPLVWVLELLGRLSLVL